MSIGVIGHCQATSIAALLNVITKRGDFVPHIIRELNAAGHDGARETLLRHDKLIVLSQWQDNVATWMEGADPVEVVLAPTIYFTAFQPDLVYANGGALSPLGNPHSAIALYGFVNGFSQDEVVDLFCDETYAALGYYDHWAPSVKSLKIDAAKTGIDLSDLASRWLGLGAFMYTPNHPMLPVMADVAVAVAAKMGLPIHLRQPARHMADPWQTGPMFPVFPEIAVRLGVDGDYLFRVPVKDIAMLPWSACRDLATFVRNVYDRNAHIDRSTIVCQRFRNGRYQILDELRGRKPSKAAAKHPYKGLPKHQFWKSAVAEAAPADLDPVVKVKFSLGAADKVAAAGSCFAQHVTRRLSTSGYNYFVAEDGSAIAAEARPARNYGVYSARYGNLYTARQLLQLFDRSVGAFKPRDDHWLKGDRVVDPFRPEIEAGGFDTLAALRADRVEHLAAVRRMWSELDVFIFTLGLTEAWRSKVDGAVFPLAPGVSGGAMDDKTYEFHNFSADEIAADLEQFAQKLKSVNADARMIVTVSPVPLVATYEERHVLVSTTYSKSALRVAAETVSKSLAHVDYFPSYEIITGSFNRGAYFESDLRGVKPEGVDHVMRVFLAHYGASSATVAAATAAAPSADSQEAAVLAEIAAGQKVVCEEELLETF